MTQPYEFSCFEKKQGEEARRAKEAAFEHDMSLVRDDARERGFQEGLLEAKTKNETQLVIATQNIGTILTDLASNQEDFQLTLEQRASELALLTAGKLANALIEREPEQEVLAMIRGCLSSGREESKIVIQVSEQLIDGLKDILDQVKLEERFEGGMILLADPELAESDCRVEWADGGSERKQADIEQAITQIIDNYVEGGEARSQALGKDPSESGPETGEDPSPLPNTETE